MYILLLAPRPAGRSRQNAHLTLFPDGPLVCFVQFVARFLEFSGMKQKDFERLVTSIKQAGAIRRGRLKPSRVTEFRAEDVRAIRLKLAKSQAEFASMIGISLATLQNWEQGRRHPEGPARALLRVAAKNPQAVAEALAS